jgi:hypothetical protein
MHRHLHQLVILAACASLAGAPGCASSRAAASRAPETPAAQPVAADPGIARFVAALPPGTMLRVRLQGGERFTATLLGVEGDTAILKPRGRVPEPSRRVPLSALADAEIQQAGSVGAGRAVLIGALAGAGTFFGLLLLALAGLD